MIPQATFQDIRLPEGILLYHDSPNYQNLPASLNSWNDVTTYLQSQGIRPEHFHLLIAGRLSYTNRPGSSTCNPAQRSLRQSLFWAKYSGCVLSNQQINHKVKFDYARVTVPNMPRGVCRGKLDRALPNTPIVKILKKLFSQSGNVLDLICKFIGYGHVILSSKFNFDLPKDSMIAHADDFRHLINQQYDTPEARLRDFMRPLYRRRRNNLSMSSEQYLNEFAIGPMNPGYLPFNVEQGWLSSDKRVSVFASALRFHMSRNLTIIHVDHKYELIFITPLCYYNGTDRVFFEENWPDNLAEATVGLETSRNFHSLGYH